MEGESRRIEERIDRWIIAMHYERMAKPSNEIKTIVKYREIPSIFAAVNGQPEDRTIGQSANISANILPFIAGHFATERNETKRNETTRRFYSRLFRNSTRV